MDDGRAPNRLVVARDPVTLALAPRLRRFPVVALAGKVADTRRLPEAGRR